MRLILIPIISLLVCCKNKDHAGQRQSNDTVTITVPASEDSNKTSKLLDSTYLTIKISADTLLVALLGQSVRLDNETKLDRFIQDNKKNIKTGRIKIITAKDFSYQKFKSTVDVLKKHEYYGFQVMTE